MFPWVSFFLLISNQSVPPSDMKYNSLNNADLNQGGKELKRADIAALYLPIKSYIFPAFLNLDYLEYHCTVLQAWTTTLTKKTCPYF